MDEDVKEWLNYLQNRLNYYDNYYTFVITAVLAMIGLLGSVVTFTTDDWSIRLIGALIIACGITIVLAGNQKLLNKILEKRHHISALIEEILTNSEIKPGQIKDKWDEIRK
jgi:ABC-type multidrug transport system fused ATPase/permease subunit